MPLFFLSILSEAPAQGMVLPTLGVGLSTSIHAICKLPDRRAQKIDS